MNTVKNSQILEKFFEKKHQQWKKECYAVFKFEGRSHTFLPSRNEMNIRENANSSQKPTNNK